ncbi:hypothetical protein, partial [Escherichia coli]|uniref:hypothetical protein n=1 Tax=Escherichia coli TaxID=562 RepID=UPI001CCBAECD
INEETIESSRGNRNCSQHGNLNGKRICKRRLPSFQRGSNEAKGRNVPSTHYGNEGQITATASTKL